MWRCLPEESLLSGDVSNLSASAGAYKQLIEFRGSGGGAQCVFGSEVVAFSIMFFLHQQFSSVSIWSGVGFEANVSRFCLLFLIFELAMTVGT